MKKLYLIWYEQGKILNIIAELTYNGTQYTFKYLNFENNELQLFSKNGLFYGFDDINKTYYSDELFSTIKSRIPSPKREDYYDIVKNLELKENFTDFDMLEATKGKISTDNFIFVNLQEMNELKNSL